jgi:hypothetical protein
MSLASPASKPEALGRVAVDSAPIITTQATGKGPKVAQLIGGTLVCLGMIGCIASQQGDGVGVGSAIFMQFVGVIIYFAGRFTAWWYHG